MKNSHVLSLSVFGCVGLLCIGSLRSVSAGDDDRYDRRGGQAWSKTPKEKDVGPIMEENNLHKRLYHEILTTDPDRNIIFSPFSIQLCLALAHLGAHGETADEIGQVIGYSSTFTTQNLSKAFQRLDEKNVLQVANKIYVKSGYELNPEYETSVREVLNSDVDSINFGQSVAAAKTINDWIEEHTNHKIKYIVQPDALDGLTRLLLVNAVYFKASWKKPFPATKTDNFTNSDSSVSDVQMMKNIDNFKVARLETLSSYVVRLDYHRTNIAMYLVIPDQIDGLTKIEQNVSQLNFHELSWDLKHVKLEVPHVDFSADVKLIAILKKLGMTTAFTDAADFSNMLRSSERVKITDAIHKAFIKIDEKGTEAGAATVMRASALSAYRPEIELELKADRPFMFAIVSDDYNVPLFMGAVKRL